MSVDEAGDATGVKLATRLSRRMLVTTGLVATPALAAPARQAPTRLAEDSHLLIQGRTDADPGTDRVGHGRGASRGTQLRTDADPRDTSGAGRGSSPRGNASSTALAPVANQQRRAPTPTGAIPR